MGIIAAGQITVVDLSDAPVLNAFITASRPTTQTYSKDSRNYNPSYASTPQVLTLNVTKSGSTTSIIDSISSLHWFVVDGSVKTEIASKDGTSNEYISGNYNEKLTTKINIDTTKGYRRYEATGVWRDPSTDLDVQFSTAINLLLTQNGATGPQGPQGDDGPQGPQGDKGETGNGIANTVVTYGLSMSDTTEPATWSSDRPALVKGMYLWTRTVIIYTNGESTTSYQISYVPKDGDVSGEIDKTKQELLEKLETVRDDSLAAVEEAKEQLETVRNDSLAAAEEAKQQVTSVSNELNTAKQDFQNAVNTVDTKATNVQNDLSQAKQDLASQRQQLQEQATAQSELTNRVSSVEETANGTKTSVSELNKTVAQNGKDITSVTARTKVVEDDLAGTKTTLSQVKMTADSTSQKTATLETGLSGLSAKFDSLSVGTVNLFKGSRDFSGSWTTNNGVYVEDYKGVKIFKTQTIWNGRSQYFEVKAGEEYVFSAYVKSSAVTDGVNFYLPHGSKQPQAGGVVSFGSANSPNNVNIGLTNNYKRIAIKIKITKDGWIAPRIERYNSDNYLYFGGYKLERGNVATDYNSSDAELEQKIAEYKQNADQNYASLQSTVQNLDGTVQHNKTVAEQTAQGFTTRIESLETYKSGESTRANKYFELAKNETARQLTVERTAIAKDYVAKSTYTSDVTGIRNELSATTTTANTIKTNLANYQASNDRAVANLQSNMQTANGNISSLKTKVEAVPGQITSAVSAVESKIPTTVGSTNLLLYSADPWQAPQTGYYQYYGAAKTSETYNGAVVYKTRGVWNRLGINLGKHLVERGLLKVGDVLTYSVLAKTDQKTPIQSRLFIRYANQSSADSPTDKMELINLTNEWQKVSVTFTVTEKMLSEDHRVTYLGWEQTTNSESDKYVYYTCNKIERGNVATDYSPAPEDAATQISSLSSQIKQTADGITLLATKTELNTAKNELQSGIKTATDKANNNAQTISTHTTQISALNTGLNAKVSQSDFNTLSGRVTTAENNITAKANELSSKITTVEGKIPTSVGGRNLWIQSKATGNFVEETLPDNHVTGQKKCYRISNNNEIFFNIEPNFSSRLYRKVTFSAWVKYDNVAQGSNNWNVFNCFKHSLIYKNSSTGATSSTSFLTLEGFTGTSDWKYISYTYDYAANKSYDQLKTSIRFNIESARSGTAWVTGVKVEIGSIPSDYSLAPEDYDSNLASVEGKIPTDISTVNLVKGTGSSFIMGYGITNTTWNETKKQSILDFSAPGVRRDIGSEILPQENKFFDFIPIKGTTYTQSIMIDTDATFNPNGQAQCSWFTSSGHNQQKAYIKKVGEHSYQVWSTYTWNLENKALRAFDWYGLHNILLFRTTGTYLAFYKPKLTMGNLPSDWSPSPQDYDDAITQVTSEIKQTADGITLLATKTELNTAKNELQSGIKTATDKANNNAQTISKHTTQISALNTGLNAKVSQSDFNTLSGRVTTAENNITAKANELSSKITTVEGKIPTDISTVNLVKGTGSSFIMGYGITNTTWNETKKQSILDFSAPGVRRDIGSEILPQENKFFDFIPIKGTTYTQSIMIDTDATFNPNGQAQCSWFTSSGHNQQKAYIKKVGEHSYQVWSTYTWNLENKALRAFDWYGLHNILLFRTTGTYLAFYKPKLTMGNLPSDWSPSPQDYDDAITQVTSEIKQTADGITLLATKTELNTAKNELQSGIKTATDKANNNAQTISKHTTQISALNTGLNAKVSQSDFNTLSGRVTTAENNITAKANELSSKITTVEGKIPTSSGGRNLAQGTSKDWSNPFTGFSGVQNTCPSLYKVLTDGLVVGDTFKTRIVLKYTNIVPASGKTAQIWLQGAGNVTGWNSGAYPSGGGGRRSFSGSGEIIFELTDKINADHLKNKYWSTSFRTDWVASGSLQWKLAKAERGMFFTDWSPAPEDTVNKINSLSSEFKQTTDSIKASVTSLNNSTVKSSSLTINSDGIVMKAGKSTTDVANAIGSYFSVNQNAINLFADKIKVKGSMIVNGAITSDKIAANAITANMITGGQLRSTNGATVLDLNAGTLTFNNNYGYIQRVSNDKVFEITTYLGKSIIDSQDFLSSSFNIRKSDNSRRSGIQFQLYNTLDNKPTATAKINSDSFTLYDSQDTMLFSVNGRNTWLGNFNTQGWGDIPVAKVYGGLIVKDIGIGGRSKSLLKIVEELCNKAGIWWM